jgi:hypothetical protein
MNPTEMVQALHDAGISGGVVWSARDGFGASLGEPAIATSALPSFAAALDWLCTESIRRYPDSSFAARYRS